MSGGTKARPRFASVVIDVDSTLAGIEGIDRLATRRGPDVARRVSELTDGAMRGVIPLESVYGERLALIGPTRDEVSALADEYLEAVAPDAAMALTKMRNAGVRIAVVSGGLREAILPLTRSLGVDDDVVRAVGIRFDDSGAYAGIDSTSPLTTQSGKAEMVRRLALPSPVLAVGDGATDLAMRPPADAFAAYTGFVRREPVMSAADHVIDSFTSLAALVLA